MTDTLPNLIPFAAFGLWTLICVILGAWLQHRKYLGKSPAPDVPYLDKLSQLMGAFNADDKDMQERAERPDAKLPPGATAKDPKTRAQV